MLKVITITLLISLSSFGNDKNTIDQLGKIQDYVGSMSTEVTSKCISCHQPEFNKCVEDVCAKGDIKKNFEDLRSKSFLELPEKLKDPKIMAIYADLKDLSEKLVRSELDLFSETVQNTKEIVNNGKFSENKEQVQFSTMMELLDFFDTKSDIPYIDNKVTELRAIIKQYSEENDFSFEPVIYYKTNYPKLDIKDAVKEDLEKLDSLKKELMGSAAGKYVPSVLGHIDGFYNSQSYHDLVKNKDITISNTSELVSMIYGMKLLIGMGSDPKFVSFARALDVDKVKEIMHSQSMKEHVSYISEQLENMKKDPAETAPYAENCANNFLAAYLNLPNEQTKKSLEKMSEEVKERFNQKIISKLSIETQKKIRPIFDSWYFFTRGKEDYLNSLKYSLQASEAEDKGELKLTKQETDIQKINENSANLSFLKANESGFIQEEVLSQLNTICDNQLPTPIDDSAYNSAINVSWGSLFDRNAGKTVMAHELGHLLSKTLKNKDMSLISRQKMWKAKACLSSQGSKENEEEDFADLISALMEGPNGNNLGCFFQQTNSSLFNIEGTDEHSSNFFRLLHVETVMRGSLPTSCNDYLVSNYPKARFQNCWQEKEVSHPNF